MPKRLDLAGQKFGYLTVVKFEYVKNGRTYWDCVCKCGQEKILPGSSLMNSETRSCGCFRKECATIKSTTHGLSYANKKTNKLEKAFYDRWSSMRYRCTPSCWKRDPTYTGTTHCDLWATFEGFRDNQPKGRSYEIGLVLSRIGDKGNYSPENCRWITKSENSIESHSHRGYTHRLVTGELAVSVARKNGIRSVSFHRRIKRGWSIEKACTTPLKII